MAKKKKEEEFSSLIKTYTGTKEEQLQQLYEQWFKCQGCELKNFRCDNAGRAIDDIVFCSGNPDASVMIVGEAPGEEEASNLVPYVGRSGKLLNQILAATAADEIIKDLYRWYSKVPRTKANEESFHNKMFEWREKAFFITNIVACRPPENRPPTPIEITACSGRLHNLIYIADPSVIIATGKVAAQSLIGHTIQVTAKRGELYETYITGKVRKIAYPTIVTLHPSHLLRKADWTIPGGDYSKTLADFGRALKIADFLNETHRGIPVPDRGIA